MLDKMTKIICDQVGLEVGEIEITPATNMREDFDIDSLDAIEIIMAIEDEFNVELPDEVVEGFSNLGELMDYIISYQ